MIFNFGTRKGHTVPNQGGCSNINTCLLTKNLLLNMVHGNVYDQFIFYDKGTEKHFHHFTAECLVQSHKRTAS
jgi:hypothetical protein